MVSRCHHTWHVARIRSTCVWTEAAKLTLSCCHQSRPNAVHSKLQMWVIYCMGQIFLGCSSSLLVTVFEAIYDKYQKTKTGFQNDLTEYEILRSHYFRCLWLVIAPETQQYFGSEVFFTAAIKTGRILFYFSIKFERLVESLPTRTETAEASNVFFLYYTIYLYIHRSSIPKCQQLKTLIKNRTRQNVPPVYCFSSSYTQTCVCFVAGWGSPLLCGLGGTLSQLIVGSPGKLIPPSRVWLQMLHINNHYSFASFYVNSNHVLTRGKLCWELLEMYHTLIVSGTTVMLRSEKCSWFLNQYLALIQRTGFRSGGCCCFDEI